MANSRVCLIIPPSGFLLDERVFPSLGVLKVAAALAQAGHPVDVCDCSGLAGDDLTAELAEAAGGCFDVYGLTATMPQMPMAIEIADGCRYSNPDARVILGGPHATLVCASARAGVSRAQQMLQELLAHFDAVVAGDGERAIFHALTTDGLIDGDDPHSPLWLTKQDLTDAPLPARRLIDLSSYHYAIDGHKTTSLIAQLGCPFGCNFCGGRRSPFLRRVRLRSTAAVVAEIRHLYEHYGYTGFMFLDDELNVNPAFMELLEALAALQRELGVDFRFRGLVKSELVTAPMAAAMFATGFRQLLIGFESGSPRMLANMNKHATRDENTRCVALLRAAGIRVKALMSLGHPGESALTAHETRDWLLAVRPDDFDVTIITIYPGTPYFDDARARDDGAYVYTAANGDQLYSLHTDHLRDINFYKGIPGQYQSFVWTDALSREQLVTARDALERDVRAALKIPWPAGPAALQFEHSMGAR